MLKHNPLLLINVLRFCNLHPILCKSCVLLKTLLKIVFSAEHSFCGSQIAKTVLEAPSKNNLFQTKCAFSVFPCAAETPIFAFSPGVNENALYLPKPNRVLQFF